MARHGLGWFGWTGLIALLTAGPALSQDKPQRPDAGGPFTAESSSAQDRGTVELETVLSWDRSRRGTDRFEIAPQIEYGLTDSLELRLTGTHALGDSSDVNRGSVVPGFRWEIAPQQGLRPSIGLLGEVSFPYGPGDAGTVTELIGLLSSTTGSGPGAWGLHLNAGYVGRLDPGRDERRDGYRFAAAVSHVVDRDSFVLLGYAQETQERGEKDLSLVEAGYQRRFGDFSFGLVAGAGLNDDSPRFRLVAGVKMEFGIGRR